MRPRFSPAPIRPPCPVCRAEEARPLLSREGRDYWRCETCRATFLDPAQHLSAPAEVAHYRHHRNEVADPGYRRFLARLAEPLLARLGPRAQGLDYGCGPGPALAAMLSEAGHRVALYDPFFFPDPAPLAQDYDFITCSEVVEHFRDPAAEFARLARMLRPGGLLAIMTCFQVDDDSFGHWHYRRDPTHVVFYREETFHHIARRHGWSWEIPRKDVVLLAAAP